MAHPARITRSRPGAKQRHGGQPVYESAGQQRHQQLELEQPSQHHEHHLQRQRPGLAHSATQRHRPGVHGRGQRLMLDRRVRFGVVERDRVWGWHVQARRALRAAQARQDHERIRAQGCRCGDTLPGRTSVSRYGYGGNAVSISRGNWQTGHAVVATKPRVET